MSAHYREGQSREGWDRLVIVKSENKSLERSAVEEPRSLLRVIATDIDFWIPLAVLIAGLVLLDRLR